MKNKYLSGAILRLKSTKTGALIAQFLFNLKKTKQVSSVFEYSDLEPFIKYNRKSLSTVKHWVDDGVYHNSIFHYGIPEEIRSLIDNNIGDEVTYSDLLTYLSKRLTRISYLELGVSVGKNFWQMVNCFKNCDLVGLDIEEINPVLENFFEKGKCIYWPTSKKSIKTSRSSITHYRFKKNNNKISYISADVFDKETGIHIPKNSYTILFSDAFHSYRGLISEWKMIKKYDLLDKNEFILMWDDLVGEEMNKAFEEIWQEVKGLYNLSEKNRIRVLTNGWIGRIEHDIGIITNFKNK